VSRPRLVLDASVVIAAALTPNRRSASCLVTAAVCSGRIELVVSPPVVAEYRRTIAEHAASARINEPAAFLEDLIAAAEPVTPEPVEAVRHDPTDDVYLGTALAGRADYLVTFDRAHLLVLDPFRGVRIVLPGTVLALLRGR
jgi:putative PIN family toxin of toxin-antitoxin system